MQDGWLVGWLVGCAFAQVGCAFAQVGCAFAQVGLDMTRLAVQVLHCNLTQSLLQQTFAKFLNAEKWPSVWDLEDLFTE